MATQLNPAAQPVSVYTGATRVDVPEPPQTNSYSQLGAALEKFAAGPGVALSHIAIENKNTDDRAFGSEAAQRAASDKSVKNVNDAVAKKLIPEGMSPTAMLAYQANFAKLRAEQDVIAQRQEYYSNGDLRNSTDPLAFQKWSQERLAQSIKGITENPDGSPVFSTLELSKSNFYGTLTHAMRGLEVEHIAHRTTENQKMFHENTSTLAATNLERDLGTGENLVPHEMRDYAALAQRLTDPWLNRDSGQWTVGGMPGVIAAKDMRKTILAKAMAEKDERLLEIADHIKTPGGRLSGSAEWKEDAAKAREHIAAEKYLSETRELSIGIQRSHGSIDQQIAEETEKHDRLRTETNKQHLVDSLEQKIYSYDPQNLTPQMLQERTETMMKLRNTDPKAATQLDMTLRKLEEEKFDLNHRRTFSIEEAKLQNIVAKHPGTPATHRVLMQALNEERIDGAAYRRLRTESDNAGNDERDPRIKGLLASHGFAMLEGKVGAGVAKDLSKISGRESIAAGLAMHDFRTQARALIKANPQLDAAGLEAAMAPLLEPTALKYNETARQEVDAEKSEKAAQMKILESLAKMQERVTEEVKALKAAPKAEEPKPEASAATKKKINTTNLKDAKTKMSLTPQEENLYNHHLRNLHGDGKVLNKDGSVSTVYSVTFDEGGKTYTIPTIWDGKKLEPKEAWNKAKSIGLDKFPSYDSPNKAGARYHDMRAYMERDLAAYQKK